MKEKNEQSLWIFAAACVATGFIFMISMIYIDGNKAAHQYEARFSQDTLKEMMACRARPTKEERELCAATLTLHVDEWDRKSCENLEKCQTSCDLMAASVLSGGRRDLYICEITFKSSFKKAYANYETLRTGDKNRTVTFAYNPNFIKHDYTLMCNDYANKYQTFVKCSVKTPEGFVTEISSYPIKKTLL